MWVSALEAGLNIASGLHQRLDSNPQIAAAAARTGRVLFDARRFPHRIPVGNGMRRNGRRLLTVGTDCSVGKMYTTLALERDMRERGVIADFRATGQTGILIAGGGVPIDALVADFISGGAEWVSPARSDGGWDLIEGQGRCSIHPSRESPSDSCMVHRLTRWYCATSRNVRTSGVCRTTRSPI